jgi:hypothetical protein
MNNQLLRRVSDVMDYIHSQWSLNSNYIPGNLEPFDYGFGIGTGVCTKPSLIDVMWIGSDGYRTFANAELPEDFHCIGKQNRGTSEYLFVMWFKDGRKFWFYDPFIVYGDGFQDSVERTGNRLNLALERWEESSYDVLYDGISDSFHLFCFGY